MLANRPWFLRTLMAGALVAAGLLATRARSVRAVSVVGDGTPQSCTEAALDAALALGGIIEFSCGPAPHTIPFTGQKSISVDTSIEGGGKITLDGQDAHRLFVVTDGTELTLVSIVLTNGYSSGDGGAISNSGTGTLILLNTTIRDSQAGASGGAIVTYGPLFIIQSVLENNQALNGGALYPRWPAAQTTIEDSVLRDNHATDASNGWGGAILAWDGAAVTILGSDIYSNTARDGGGIYNFSNSMVTLEAGTQVRDNFAANHGGGLYNAGLAIANLSEASLSGNEADYGGGLSNAGKATLTDVAISGNSGIFGGGLYNAGTAELTNVTLNDNSGGEHGGGLYNADTAELTNVTVSGNTASTFGGGLFNDDLVILINVTLSGNSANVTGGGLYGNGGEMWVENSIVANSPTGGDCAGILINAGFNLATDDSCGFDQVPDVLIGPLAANGGPTQTHALAAGSPAIDAANNDSCPAMDQRGVPRPLDGDGDNQAVCDIGAFEYQIPTTTTILADDPDPSQPGEPLAVSLSVTGALGLPTGVVTVTVSDDPQFCVALLVGELGSCALALSVPGTYTLTATYGSEGAFASSSATELHTVEASYRLSLPVILRD